MVLSQAMAWVQYWFRILSLKFCGKSKKNCGDISPQSPAFCMYAHSPAPQCFWNLPSTARRPLKTLIWLLWMPLFAKLRGTSVCQQDRWHWQIPSPFSMVIQAQVTQNRMTRSCKLCQDKKSLKQGLRILNPEGSPFLRIRMTNPRILDPRISNPLKTISKPKLQSRIKDPQS